jgi:alpha-maltose-1-phosphate synthase
MRVLLAHPGTQHSFHLARELERCGFLGEFWTGLAFPVGGLAARLAHSLRGWPGVGGLPSRIIRGVAPAKLHTQPGCELQALYRLRRGQEAHAVLQERNEKFQRAIPDSNLCHNDAVIAFDTSAWILAERCQRLGRPLFLDRTIAHPVALARILGDFRRRYPDWVAPAEQRPAAVAMAEAREHELARRIVVGCTYARDSLVAEGIPADKLRVNPYGVDWRRFVEAAQVSRQATTRPLRFLFVGSVTARKGVPVLLEAWRALAPREAELWIAGNIGARERPLIPALPGLRCLGQVPHAEMPSLFAQSDVFVLPSLFEGFGLVLLEALASGLPIIATRHTGAVDFLGESALGELIEAGSVESLIGALQRYLERRPDRSQVLAAAAPLEARFSWSAYGDRWAELLRQDLSPC